MWVFFERYPTLSTGSPHASDCLRQVNSMSSKLHQIFPFSVVEMSVHVILTQVFLISLVGDHRGHYRAHLHLNTEHSIGQKCMPSSFAHSCVRLYLSVCHDSYNTVAYSRSLASVKYGRVQSSNFNYATAESHYPMCYRRSSSRALSIANSPELTVPNIICI